MINKCLIKIYSILQFSHLFLFKIIQGIKKKLQN